MTISIPIDFSVDTPVNVTDSRPTIALTNVTSESIVFSRDTKYKEDATQSVYGRTGPTVTPKNLVPTATTYKLGDIVIDTTLQRYKVITEFNTNHEPISYDVVYELADLSGFTYYSPTEPYLPFDNKNYTVLETTTVDPITFKLKGNAQFDTICLSGVIADKIDVTFRDSSGTLIDETLDYRPNNTRDIDGKLPDYQATVILYSLTPVPANGTVEVTLHGANIRLGTAIIGSSVAAGFTNLNFTNSFKDYSPYEKDQWGNIMYVDGVRTNYHTGTVDVPLYDYDMLTRLMVSIGGNTVILNGSDMVLNNPVTPTATDNNVCVFASTMLVGRLSGFTMKTKVVRGKLAPLATYTFKIEEQV